MKQAGFDPTKCMLRFWILGDRAVTFYKEEGCKGEGWMFLGNVPSLSAYGFDGSKVKSMEIKPVSRDQISMASRRRQSSINEDAVLANDGKCTYWRPQRASDHG